MRSAYNIYIFIIIAIMGTLCSCVSEESFTYETNPPQENRQLSLLLSIPGANTPITFAYSPVGENEIRTVDILVFKVSSEGEYYYKHIPVRSIESDNNTSKKLNITLDAIDTRLILLANVSHLFTDEVIQKLENNAESGDLTKQDILKRFIFSFNKPWNATTFYAENAFPMYGESEIISAKSKDTKEIKMIRAIARIDIANEMQNTNWSIDSVYIFNTRNQGYVAPAFDHNGKMLETTNIPSTAQNNKTAFGFPFFQNAGTSTPSMEREIYITEDNQDGTSPTVIVLKMTCEGNKSYFYSVDLKGLDGERMPVLRNYRYRIFIKGVTGEGYSTAEEALATANSSHISTGIETNELGLSNIVFNSKYKLGVSEGEIYFNSDGSWKDMTEGEDYYSLKVYTTYTGWSLSLDNELAEWLKFSDSNINNLQADFPASYHFLELVAEPNKSNLMRTGKIQIKSGNLRMEVTIIQDGNRN